MKAYQADAEWFFDRHPLAHAFVAFFAFFTFYSLFACFWSSDLGGSYAMHTGKVVIKAGLFAVILSAIRRWRKARRASPNSDTKPVT
jgi:hypothetical protein